MSKKGRICLPLLLASLALLAILTAEEWTRRHDKRNNETREGGVE
jgi:hypothetical protein